MAAPGNSRVIVKNLPPHATEERLRELFAPQGEVTDCRVKRTRDGRSRNFGFVGFRNSASAEAAVKKLNRSFFDTARMSVEMARVHGDTEIERPWSRYTPGSTAHAKDTGGGPEKTSGNKNADAASASDDDAEDGDKDGAQHTGDGADRRLTKPVIVIGGRAASGDVAFDDEVDDMAYLMKRTKATKKKTKAAKKKDAPKEGGAANTKQGEAGDDGTAFDSGRLYVTNLPYGATDDEVRAHFEAVGDIRSVAVCKDEDTLKSRGFGYVTFVFSEHSAQAVAELDQRPFQGRVIAVRSAQDKPAAPDLSSEQALKGRTSSYKRRLQERKKKVDAHMEHSWNLLYVSANAATDAAASQLGISKSDMIGKDAENPALTAALAETSIIQQTKRWLQNEGIRVEAFEQTGATLAQSKSAAADDGPGRRDDTLIVKHLPAKPDAQELRERFARFGQLLRCSLSPSGTIAVVQYAEVSMAKRAFQKLAFSRYRHAPLYLEWAPGDVFIDAVPPTADAGSEKKEEVVDAANVGKEDEVAEDDESARGWLFVKNLNFATRDISLRAAFNGCPGFRAATVMQKKVAAGKETGSKDSLSMGYGFVEFDTAASATEALKRKQGIIVDEHALQLQISRRGGGGHARRGASQGATGKAGGGKDVSGPLKTSKLCVRNLAFEVTKRELSRLFGSYGAVSSVRLPKKADYSGHRGFGFVEFASKAEAAAAYEALQHTHLYGRRLVIQAAEDTADDVGAVQEATAKRHAVKEMKSEAKKRQKTGVLNAAGGEKSFKEAMSFE